MFRRIIPPRPLELAAHFRTAQGVARELLAFLRSSQSKAMFDVVEVPTPDDGPVKVCVLFFELPTSEAELCKQFADLTWSLVKDGTITPS